ncbi:dual specificity protein kinase [Achlya hypogyna]|uniref:Dual specificity protein kinase n=1 Tax=Achlya hypogyna TaxID=1202772 RepID=A0A1V9YK88_ACHHY|nr:dual specificity protein kinase [Achlya hypogyna]
MGLSMDLIHGTTTLHARYLFLREVGHGISSTVLLALDTTTKSHVALKVLFPELRVAGDLERALLASVAERDPDHHVPIVACLDAFTYMGCLVLVLELLGPPIFARPITIDEASLMDAARQPNACHAAPHMDMSSLRCVVAQTCAALSVLHDMNVIHADLKPENILWEIDSRNRVKLVDYGNAIDSTAVQIVPPDHDFEIQTLLYRAPEVAMGVSVSCAIDLWSLGCIVLESVVGRPLFTASTNARLLAQMQQLTPRPLDEVRSIPTFLSFLTETQVLPCGLHWKAFRQQPTLPPISLDAICDAYAVDAIDGHLRSFLKALLEPHPSQRLTAKQAFFHPFLGAMFPFGHVFAAPAPRVPTEKRKQSLLRDALQMIESSHKLPRLKKEPRP